MKVGIITITQGCNYGNRLQIYAVQQVLKDIGIESRLIKNNTGINSLTYKIKSIVKYLINYKDYRDELKRYKSFNKFDREYIQISDVVLDENYNNSSIALDYDAFICGSDQLWNPNYSRLNGIYFADFSNVKKRISYAASFGVNQLPANKISQYRHWLDKFDYISVREESGREIIKELLGRDSTVLIDPTMMIDSENWIKIEKQPDVDCSSKYILCYFLGEKNSKILSYIDAMKIQMNATVIDVLPESKKNPLYYSNPSNFVYLVHHAEMIITDSFHATVFSILFMKRFRVFDREDQMKSMTTRLDTLLDYFELTKYRNNFDTCIEMNWPFDVGQKLKAERIKAYNFLKEALL